jgi:hypothetical protein
MEEIAQIRDDGSVGNSCFWCRNGLAIGRPLRKIGRVSSNADGSFGPEISVVLEQCPVAGESNPCTATEEIS